MSTSRFLPFDGSEVRGACQPRSAIPERAAHIRLISLSFDPEHDTPEVLAKHAQGQGPLPPLWVFAVASHEELNKTAGRWGSFTVLAKTKLCTIFARPSSIHKENSPGSNSEPRVTSGRMSTC